MKKILANDGLSRSGIDKLQSEGFQVITDKVNQDDLIQYINNHQIEVVLVRSATEVRKDIIDSCPSLKIIGRGGVGMDNIDVEYAREKGLKVINTPAASSESVAELVFAHLYSGMRFLYDSNRNMPSKGYTDFAKLKKAYAGGIELRGKTIGIIGMGRIGLEVARIALGLRMKVIAADTCVGKTNIEVDFYNGQSIQVDIETEPIENILKKADIITLHIPSQKGFVIGQDQFNIMKEGVVLINCARGGVIDEEALIEALDSGKVRFAGLDVFENEPTPSTKILSHSKISLSPHIGAATLEAQDRIGTELATQIIQILS
ncbi:3-phosphoglycerate dehydrogenase [Elizabethkingia argentiflava]|uniref:3-phosphoglycerate dehydrogenase n=1 Tax=Elizabethkingia argenteiflava TaxID=2681556 RepID=A0A845PVT3_9FLAO|nr:NAD(P)-dependent oxidoreductase [Elizabethkingia argenteiflava]NAW51755.1 3-phosphoglycerate dehydrogenase [Elizabethkingia argenteiflava]